LVPIEMVAWWRAFRLFTFLVAVPGHATTLNDKGYGNLHCPQKVLAETSQKGLCTWTDSEGKVIPPDPIKDASWFAQHKWSMTDKISTPVPTENKSYNVGEHQVIFTGSSQEQKDGSKLPVECKTIVTVSDTEPPVWTKGQCNSKYSIGTEKGKCEAAAAWTPPVASDNCDAQSEMTYRLPFEDPLETIFPLGAHVLTYTASDKAGNTATCPITIEVIDDEAPVLTCPPLVYAHLKDGYAEASCQYAMEVSWSCHTKDNCGSYDYKCDKAPGSAFPLGDTTVTCSVVDKAGNKAEAKVLVQVLDLAPPRITCPDDFEVAITSNQPTVPVKWPLPYTTDNSCELDVPVEVTGKRSGDRLPAGVHDIEYRVVDKSGLASSCTFQITVHDMGAPSFGERNVPKVVPGLFGDIGFRPSAVDNLEYQVIDLLDSQEEELDQDEMDDDEKVFLDKGPKKAGKGLKKAGKGPKKAGKGLQKHMRNMAKKMKIFKNPKDAEKAYWNTFWELIEGSKKKGFKAAEERMNAHCPSDIVVETAPQFAYGIAHFNNPIAMDNQNEDAAVSYGGQTFVRDGFKFPVGETRITVTASDKGKNQATCTFKVNVIDNEPPWMGQDAILLQCPMQPNGKRAAGAAPYAQCGGVHSKLLTYTEGQPTVMTVPDPWKGPTTCCRPDYECKGDDQFKSCLPKGMSAPPLPHDCGGESYSTTIKKVTCDRVGHTCTKHCAEECHRTEGCVGFAAHDMGCGSAVYSLGDPNFDVWCPKDKCGSRTPRDEQTAHLASRNLTGWDLRRTDMSGCQGYGHRASECLLKSFIAPISTSASYSMEWDCYKLPDKAPARPRPTINDTTPSSPDDGAMPLPTAQPTQNKATFEPTAEPTSSPTVATFSPTVTYRPYTGLKAVGNGDLSGCYRPEGNMMYNGHPMYVREDKTMTIRYSVKDSGWDWCPSKDGVVVEPCELENNRGGFSHDDHGRPWLGHIFNWADYNQTLTVGTCTQAPTKLPTKLPTSKPTSQPTRLQPPPQIEDPTRPNLPETAQPTTKVIQPPVEGPKPTSFPTHKPTQDPTPSPTRQPTYHGCAYEVLNDKVLAGRYHEIGRFNKHPLYIREDNKRVIRYGSTDNGWDYCESREGLVDHICSGSYGRLAYSRDTNGYPELGKIMGWGLHWGNATLVKRCSSDPPTYKSPTPYMGRTRFDEEMDVRLETPYKHSSRRKKQTTTTWNTIVL